MKLTHHSDRHWERVIKSLALAIAVGGLALLVPGGGPAPAASPTLEAIQGLPQDWDKTLPANDPGGACPSNSSRFTCVMGGAGHRDRPRVGKIAEHDRRLVGCGYSLVLRRPCHRRPERLAAPVPN